MDEIQRQKIRKLRSQGYGYLRISSLLEISPNTIRSFCKKENIKHIESITVLLLSGLLFCASANADLLCVEKKIAVKGQLAHGSKMKVVNAERCSKGVVKLLNIDDMKGPKGNKCESLFEEQYLTAGVMLAVKFL